MEEKNVFEKQLDSVLDVGVPPDMVYLKILPYMLNQRVKRVKQGRWILRQSHDRNSHTSSYWYVDGKFHGTCIDWYVYYGDHTKNTRIFRHGVMLLEKEVKNTIHNVCFKQRNKEGKFDGIYFDKKYDGTFKNGKKHGKFCIDYGNSIELVEFANNRRVGISNRMNKDGNSSVTVKYVNGVKHGEIIRVRGDPLTGIFTSGYYHYGKKHGKWLDNGNETNYKYGKLHGIVVIRKFDFSSITFYKEGQKHGPRISFNARLTPKYFEYYINGRSIFLYRF